MVEVQLQEEMLKYTVKAKVISSQKSIKLTDGCVSWLKSDCDFSDYYSKVRPSEEGSLFSVCMFVLHGSFSLKS